MNKSEKLDSGVPIIVLGGRGYIGSHLLPRLEIGRGYSVDVASPEDIWPQHLTGKPTILINVANRRALRKYASKLWAGLTLLYEVYPEPSRQEIAAFTQLGNSAYHIVGIKASSYSDFPKVYAGGIPCCAGWPSENIEAIIRKLNDENAMR